MFSATNAVNSPGLVKDFVGPQRPGLLIGRLGVISPSFRNTDAWHGEPDVIGQVQST